MKEEWLLLYQVQRILFGISFLILTGSCLRAMIRAANTTSLSTESPFSYAINGLFVLFNLSRALALLLYGYVNDEPIPTTFATEEFFFNIGYPYLIAAYTRIIYSCLSYKNRLRPVFILLIMQCYISILARIAETIVPCDQDVCNLYVKFILSSCSMLCALCAFIFYAKIFRSNYSNDIEKSNDLRVEFINTTSFETAANKTNNRKSNTMFREIVCCQRKSKMEGNVVTVLISCVWIVCFVIWGCIVTGHLKQWGNDIDVENWHSWMYANVLRTIELGNAAIMSYLVQRVTHKQKSSLQT